MPATHRSKDFITTSQAAKRLQCSVATVYRLIGRGAFPAQRLGAGYRIWLLPFEAWRTQSLRQYQSRKGA